VRGSRSLINRTIAGPANGFLWLRSRHSSASCLDTCSHLANQSLRTPSIGHTALGGFGDEERESVERDLTQIGIIDPIRLAVPKSIGACRRAGGNTRILTGDLMNTAKSIAEFSRRNAPTGAEYSAMSKLQLLDILRRLQDIARLSPLAKYRMFHPSVASRSLRRIREN
jgi:Ca2+-transporting ATPase